MSEQARGAETPLSARWLLLAVVGCQPYTAESLPDVLVDPDGPQFGSPVCSPLRGQGLLRAGTDCRLDGVMDLDGDGRTDCWRATRSQRQEQIWIWARCAGEPTAIEIERDTVMRIELAVPRWARGVATILAGDTKPGGLVERYLSETPSVDGIHRYTPTWYAGTPTLQPGAAVIDPPRVLAYVPARTYDDEKPPTRPIHVLAIDPAFDELLAAEDAHLRTDLVKFAQCDRWTVWTSNRIAAVSDRATDRWSFVYLRDDGGSLRELTCVDDVVLIPKWGHGRMMTAIDPVSGGHTMFGYDGADYRTQLAGGMIRSWPAQSIRQLRGRLANARPSTTPCETALPLLSATPDGACTLSGKRDLDRDGVDDCWTAEHTGTREVGTMSWHLQVDLSCTEHAYSRVLELTRAVSSLDVELPARAQRRAAELLVGADRVHCIPATADCSAPDPAVAWIVGGRGPLRWLPGTPRLANATTITLVPGKLENGIPVAPIIYNPRAVSLGRGELSRVATCGHLDLWIAPAGGAVVDTRAKVWAWLYVASDPFLRLTYDANAPIVRAWCDDTLALFELGHPERGSVIAADARTGEWASFHHTQWAKLAPFDATRVRAAIRVANKP